MSRDQGDASAAKRIAKSHIVTERERETNPDTFIVTQTTTSTLFSVNHSDGDAEAVRRVSIVDGIKTRTNSMWYRDGLLHREAADMPSQIMTTYKYDWPDERKPDPIDVRRAWRRHGVAHRVGKPEFERRAADIYIDRYRVDGNHHRDDGGPAIIILRIGHYLRETYSFAADFFFYDFTADQSAYLWRRHDLNFRLDGPAVLHIATHRVSCAPVAIRACWFGSCRFTLAAALGPRWGWRASPAAPSEPGPEPADRRHPNTVREIAGSVDHDGICVHRVEYCDDAIFLFRLEAEARVPVPRTYASFESEAYDSPTVSACITGPVPLERIIVPIGTPQFLVWVRVLDDQVPEIAEITGETLEAHVIGVLARLQHARDNPRPPDTPSSQGDGTGTCLM
jgi:hypothetical protein